VYNSSDGLINDTVQAVAKDGMGNWWFGTKHGLSKFDNTSWTSYTVETHNIISNNIKFLAKDIDGKIWFASDVGLSYFNGDTWINFTN
jgi:ligand-binding sensor domain-containing protein